MRIVELIRNVSLLALLGAIYILFLSLTDTGKRIDSVARNPSHVGALD